MKTPYLAYFWLVAHICVPLSVLVVTGSSGVEEGSKRMLQYDPNGYLIFCLCMGRFGKLYWYFKFKFITVKFNTGNTVNFI